MGLLTTLNALGGGGCSLPSQTGNNGKFLTTDGSNPSWASISGGGDMLAANNLSDLASAPAARTNLGLGALATLSTVGDAQISSGIDAAKIGAGAVSNTEFEYLEGVTSAIQTQLNAKITSNSAITGATKTKITFDAKGLVTAGADATTADIADSTNKRYVTDAQLSVIGNTSGTNTGDQTITLTGDVTGSGTGSFAASIASAAVTNAKLANMANATIKGRTSAGTGDPEDLTVAQATALLNAFAGDSGSGGTKGLVPAPNAGDAAANKFLKANGTWDTVAGGGGGSGDVTAASNIGDNKLVRGDGGVKGIQQSGITIDDSNNISGINTLSVSSNISGGNDCTLTGGLYANYTYMDTHIVTNGGYITSDSDAGNTFTLSAWDVDGDAAETFITFTSNNAPTCDLADSVTKAGSYIYRAGGTDVPITDGGTGASTASGARTNLGLAIGTDIQGYNANLTTWAGKTAPGGTVVGTSDSQTLTNKTLASPIISAISNTGTSTVPTSTGILTNRSSGVFDAAITSTITWDGTTPSGASNLRYSWQQFGGWVFAQFRLEYATGGSTNTQVSIDLPSDMPLPVDFTGTDDGEVMMAGSGNAYTGLTSSGSQAKVMLYKDASATSGYLLWCRGFSSGAAKGAVMFIAYPCISGSRL